MRLTKSAVLTSMFLLGGLVTATVPACAEIVNFSTITGSIFSNDACVAGSPANCNSTNGTNVFTNSGSTLTFSGIASAAFGQINTPGQHALGTFSADIGGTGLLAGGNFTLEVDQTVPGPPTSGTFGLDAFTGAFTNDGGVHGGQTILTFAQTSLVINGIQYTLQDLGQGGLAPNQLGIGVTGTTVQAFITPEPAFYGLMGIGLAGLFAVGMRRKNRQAV
jgi:hypothetical protein